MATFTELVENGIGPISRIPACRALLGAAAFSWWRPFPVPIYLYEEFDHRISPLVLDSLARAVTEISGRSRESGDRVLEHRVGDAYLGPEPYLFGNVVPAAEPRGPASEWRHYLSNIVDGMANSQRPENVPEVEKRIRLSVVTGSQALPSDFAASFYSFKVPTKALEVDWFGVTRAKVDRLLLGEELRAWIDGRQDPEFFASLDDLQPGPRDAATLGVEMFNRFLAQRGLDPLRDEVPLDRIRQRAVAVKAHRVASGEPGLVTLMRDVLRDAVATGEARLEPDGSGRIVLGRVAGDRLYISASEGRDLVLRTGHTTASRAVFTRSLVDDGWVEPGRDGAGTVPRRIDGKMTRAWDLPTSFLGEMVRSVEGRPGPDSRQRFGTRRYWVAEGLSEYIRTEIRAAVVDQRARLTAAGEGIDLGREVKGRLYLIPAGIRTLLSSRDAASPPSISLSRALAAEGWLIPASDGSWTVPRRIDGALRRVWDLPAAFLEEDAVQRAL